MRVFRSFVRMVWSLTIGWYFFDFGRIFIDILQRNITTRYMWRNTSRSTGDTWWVKQRLKEEHPENTTVKRLSIIPTDVTKIDESTLLCEKGMERIEAARPY